MNQVDGYKKLASKIVNKRNYEMLLEEARYCYRKEFLSERKKFLEGSIEDHIVERRRTFHRRKILDEVFSFTNIAIREPYHPNIHPSLTVYEVRYVDNCGRQTMILSGKRVEDYIDRVNEEGYNFKKDLFIINIENITGKRFVQYKEFKTLYSFPWRNIFYNSGEGSKRPIADCCKRGFKVGESIYAT